MAISTIKVTGINTKYISDEEIIELAETASFLGEEPDGFVKLVLKQTGNKGDGKGYYGFQGCLIQSTSDNGSMSLSGQLYTDSLGKPSGVLKMSFAMNKMGLNVCYLPVSEFNIQRLIEEEARIGGSPWNIKDKGLNTRVLKEASKLLKKKQEIDAEATALATTTVHSEHASTIKALKETYGEAYVDMKEYKDNILPLIGKSKREIMSK